MKSYIQFVLPNLFLNFVHFCKISYLFLSNKIYAVDTGLRILVSISDGLNPYFLRRKMENTRPMRKQKDGKIISSRQSCHFVFVVNMINVFFSGRHHRTWEFSIPMRSPKDLDVIGPLPSSPTENAEEENETRCVFSKKKGSVAAHLRSLGASVNGRKEQPWNIKGLSKTNKH